MQTKVLVAICAHGGDVQLGTIKAVLGQTAWARGVRMAFDGDSKAPLHAAREEMLGRALLDPDITHLWFVDADMLTDPDCLEQLLGSGKEVVAGIYRMRYQLPLADGSRINALSFGDIADEVVEADGKTKTRRVKATIMAEGRGSAKTGWVAGGHLLIARAAIEKLGKKAFRPVESDGEDLQFSFNCAKAGIDVWVNVDARAGHLHKVVVWTDDLYAGGVSWHPGMLKTGGTPPVYLREGAGPEEADIYMVRRGMTPERIGRAVKRLRKMERRSASIGGV